MSIKIEDVKSIIIDNKFKNQQEIVDKLDKSGIKTTQSTVSRLLVKIKAIKIIEEGGYFRYTLLEQDDGNYLKNNILTIEDNGSIIVIKTKAGFASAIAEILDNDKDNGIMGTVAGENTIMVIPAEVRKIKEVVEKLRVF